MPHGRTSSFALSLLASLLALGAIAGAPSRAGAQPGTSELWGREGERWDPDGRLPDYSFAGYHAGRDPIPDVREVVHVRDFGARPGDGRDDTREIQRALDAAAERGGGAVVLGSGRYEISDVIRMRHSGVVLRGQGRSETTIFVRKNLSQVVRGGWSEAITRSYGFLQVGGGGFGEGTAVVEDAPRGARWLTLRSVPSGLRRGAYVRLEMDPDEGDRSLWDSRHADQNGSPHTPYCDEIYSELGYWIVRVVSVDGRRIELEQPLRTEIRTRWHPRIQAVRAVQEVGIEGLAIEFPHTSYPGHHLERGYNAIDLAESGPVIHAWVRNVLIRNADNGVNLSRAKHVTVRNVRVVGDRGGYDGHHAFTGGIDCLYEDLEIDARFWHAVTFNERTTGTVVSRGTGGARWSLDHHSRAQLENLITDLRTSYDWISGGGACSPRAGARHTYWRFDRPIDPPNWSEIQTTVVGDLAAGVPERRTPRRQWFEEVRDLSPRNLYEAQLARRLEIENVGRFAEGALGRRTAWLEQDPRRWALSRSGGERRYWLATSVHSSREGGRVGEQSIADTAPLRDVELRGRARTFELLRANDGADYALLLGWSGPREHYMALFHADRARAGIYRVRDGERRKIADASVRIADDGWHWVGFRRSGTRLEMLFDGAVVARADDGAIGAGRVGIGSLDDSAMFDDLEVVTSEAMGMVARPEAGEDEPSALPFDGGEDPSDTTGLLPDPPSDDGDEGDVVGADAPEEAGDGGGLGDAGVSSGAGARGVRAAGCSVAAGARGEAGSWLAATGIGLALAARRRRRR